MDIQLQQFKRGDFDELRSWYSHPSIKNALGTLDEEWLEDVLTDMSNLQFCGFIDDELIASIGLYRPEDDFPFYIVAEIAVKPSQQRKGIGSQILEMLFIDEKLRDSDVWLAFVDVDNVEAIEFFKVNGWGIEDNEPDEENLLAYKKINPTVSI